jgi:hypothetical protein
LDWINLPQEKREFFELEKKTAFFGINFFERGIFGKIGFLNIGVSIGARTHSLLQRFVVLKVVLKQNLKNI